MSCPSPELEGVLTVVDPVADPVSLLAAIVLGFGAARACGCGPMPIRRRWVAVGVGDGEFGCEA